MKKIPNPLGIWSNGIPHLPNDLSFYEDVGSSHTNYIRNKLRISALDITKKKWKIPRINYHPYHKYKSLISLLKR